MASFEMKLSGFRPNRAGIYDTWTSDGMVDVLSDRADSLREAADELGAQRMPEDFRPQYMSGVDLLRHTVVGYVTTGRSKTGRPNPAQIDQCRHQTLDALNH